MRQDDFAGLSQRNVFEVTLGSFEEFTQPAVVTEMIMMEQNQPLHAGIYGNVNANKWCAVDPQSLFSNASISPKWASKTSASASL